MVEKLNVAIASILLLIAFNLPVFGSENALASDTIKVKITVPVIQKVEIVNPAVVEFEYPWEGAEDGNPLVIENAGALRVKSNADWALKLDNLSTGTLEVLVRRTDDDNSDWRPVSGSSGYFYGEQGREKVGFDLKIKPPEGAVQSTTAGGSDLNQTTRRVQLSYTLEQN
ncbi:hypothetical protein KGY71_07200 [Candidatus Bipolaricaulota bacterium]|nr:hypothetical protein [Candidatus Bipolaricaulota bacterium]